MKVGRKIRHLQRYREIAMAFVRNGFGFVAKELGLRETFSLLRSRESREVHNRTIGERIRMLLEELGPTFVKLGQIASTRADLIPGDILAELERLQDNVQPFTYEEAVRIIEDELGAPVEQLFRRFEATPLASASIGQVYRAEMSDGSQVAVKIQRPGIQVRVETDLDILAELARLAENRMEWARKYRVRDMVEEIAKALRGEMDYGTEGRNAERFVSQTNKLDYIQIPGVYWDYSTRRVLTMEYVEGIKLSDRDKLDEEGFDRKKIAERYTTAILQQVLIDGFFHGDPHPGNVLVLRDGSLALLDFGMVGRLSPEVMRHFTSFVIALRNQSSSGVIRAVSSLGLVPEDADMAALHADVDRMKDKYYKVPLSQVSLGEAVNELFNLALRHQIRIPTELTLLGKTLLTMEGVVKALDPSFSIFDVAEPFGRRLLLKRFDPRSRAKKWVEDIPDYIDVLAEIPMNLKDLLALIRKGRFGLEVRMPELDTLMKKMDRISNRLSFSIVLLSLSIIMVGLIIGSSMGHQNTVLWKIPVIEIGFGIALLLFLWLIYAIFRSGRF